MKGTKPDASVSHCRCQCKKHLNANLSFKLHYLRNISETFVIDVLISQVTSAL